MSAVVLLSAGIVFVVAEIFLASFFLLFIGIGLLGTAGLEYFVGFGRLSASANGVYLWQAVSICAISLLSFLLLKKPLQKRFNRSQQYSDVFDEMSGVGEIRAGMVDFKGTLWAYEIAESSMDSGLDSAADSVSNAQSLAEGQRVKVLGIKNGRAIIAAPESSKIQQSLAESKPQSL